uniref:Uncharacterized protein n=1 Tax=Chrysemys picta bellii TaxID=8478 RepID=A0A8C3J103_CHRPI
MAFTSTYSQAAAQQGYSAYAAQPAQGYAQTTQAYGQQSYGTYGQPRRNWELSPGEVEEEPKCGESTFCLNLLSRRGIGLRVTQMKWLSYGNLRDRQNLGEGKLRQAAPAVPHLASRPAL